MTSYQKNIQCLQNVDLAEADMNLSKVIRQAPYYLVFAFGCRQDGASGYKIVRNVQQTMARSYPAMVFPEQVSRRGKTLICSEYSHDVPLGNRTVIVALTRGEKYLLESADFTSVQQFAKAKAAKIK